MRTIVTIALMLMAFGSEAQQLKAERIDSLPDGSIPIASSVYMAPDGTVVFAAQIDEPYRLVIKQTTAREHLMSNQGGITLTPGVVVDSLVYEDPEYRPGQGRYKGSIADLNDFDWTSKARKGDFYRVVNRDLDIRYNGKNWVVVVSKLAVESYPGNLGDASYEPTDLLPVGYYGNKKLSE